MKADPEKEWIEMRLFVKGIVDRHQSEMSPETEAKMIDAWLLIVQGMAAVELLDRKLQRGDIQ